MVCRRSNVQKLYDGEVTLAHHCVKQHLARGIVRFCIVRDFINVFEFVKRACISPPVVAKTG
jgi:hypothetical protein